MLGDKEREIEGDIEGDKEGLTEGLKLAEGETDGLIL